MNNEGSGAEVGRSQDVIFLWQNLADSFSAFSDLNKYVAYMVLIIGRVSKTRLGSSLVDIG